MLVFCKVLVNGVRKLRTTIDCRLYKCDSQKILFNPSIKRVNLPKHVQLASLHQPKNWYLLSLWVQHCKVCAYIQFSMLKVLELYKAEFVIADGRSYVFQFSTFWVFQSGSRLTIFGTWKKIILCKIHTSWAVNSQFNHIVQILVTIPSLLRNFGKLY